MRDNDLLPCDLYRHFDADGKLFYVGITANSKERQRNHVRNSTWSTDIVRTTTERFPTRAAAMAAEANAIRDERPLHNRSWRQPNPTAEPRPGHQIFLTLTRRQFDVLSTGATRRGLKLGEYCRRLLDAVLDDSQEMAVIVGGHPEEWDFEHD